MSTAPTPARGAGPFALLALLAAGLAAFAAPRQEEERAPALVETGRRERLEDLSGDDCIRCHGAIGEEWRASLHAVAWQDERYQEELRKTRRKTSCHGCHIPELLARTELPAKPATRSEHWNLGVHCTTCHLDADGETVLGPLGISTDAHPTRKTVLFDHERSNLLCITCHDTSIGPVIGIAKDFVETEQAELGLSCVDCHMPAVRRPIADPEEGEPYPERRGRSHRLEGPRDPAFLREAFLLRAERSAGGARLVVENQAGHRVPGLVDRRLDFRARLVDAAGATVAQAEHAIDSRAYLPVEGSFELSLAGAGVALEVTGEHLAPGARAQVRFLEERFELE